ncbi:hypothetical protein CSC74_14325 [Pseudoxanthomonas yeongjuensis]|uniref:TonB-dependent receptor n=1 Tax=Pseudoxanthomonas yeongjuensis TaxID=377616 RepID=UPI001FE81767|nr:TonB-dependent receptor [Pseudoxanthomonas yeongjuensis]KAF1715237.1 hypothetical protein CSC74_14325 [Pseudoxanthomonas yeongjuensis]
MLATGLPESTCKKLALVSALTIALSTTAQAQQEQPTQEGEAGKPKEAVVLDAVTVTAERFTSTVQTTPVAITALTAETLAERQVTNVLTAASEIPGIMITPSQGSNTSARIAMRGVGQSTAGINFDPAVGIYIDNVYQPRINGAFFDFFDIDRLEVLRGPQGTLYGRNSSGGALKIETRRPSAYWTGKAELSAGNFDALGTRFYASGPLIEDTLAFSLSGVTRERDGYLYGTEYGRRIGNIDSRAQRAKLLYTPNEKFEVEGSVFSIQDFSEAGVPVPLQVLPGINIPEANGTFDRDLTRTETYGPLGQGSIHNTGASINARYFLSDAISLSSTTGYGNQRTFSTGNTIWVSLAMQQARDRGEDVNLLSANEGRTRNVFYSQEFNATYTSDKFKGVLGLYYFDEEGQSRAVAASSPTIDQDRNTRATAVFAQGTYEVGAGVGVTAGIRYTEERADFTQFYRTLLNVSQNAKKTYTATTPKLGVNWEPNSQVMVYASWTQGFKSGGFNPIPPNANTGVPDQIGAPTPYDPESVDSYEVGMKYTAPNNRFRLNVAAYRAEYDGLQLPVFFPGTSTIYTSNATGGVVRGIELEPSWQVSDSLLLYGNASFTDGEYTGSFACANQFGQVIDCGDRDIANLIPRKAQLGFRLTPEVPGLPGQLRINGSWNHHSAYFNNVANEGPLVQTVSASIYNAGIGWISPGMRWEVNLDVRNAADKHYSLAGLQQSNPVRPAVSAYPNPPREVMLRIGVSF